MSDRPSVLVRVTVALLGLVVVACGGGSGTSGPSGPLSATEMRYGRGPATNAGVTYQPDVVLVGGGADAVRAWSADGLTWTIKGDAPGVDQLAPGKIMFVTGFGVGRVLAINAVGKDRAVTIGPVELTDVIKDANLSSSQPISLGSPTFYSAPDLPGTLSPGPTDSVSVASAREAGDDPILLPALRLTGTNQPPPPGQGPAMPPPSGSAPSAALGSFHLAGSCCKNGLGVELTYDDGGLQMTGQIGLTFATPQLKFVLAISGGKVVTAELQASGAVGIVLGFDAATRVGREGNVNKRVELPVLTTVPLLGLGVPFYAELTQWFVLKTAFSAKDSTLRASGVFSFGGTLGFGYSNGSFGVSAPSGFAVKQSLTDSITGLSIGAAGLVLAHQARFCICLGAFGFATGLYFMLTTSFGVTNDSSAQAVLRGVRCHGASLDMVTRYGWGYTIPKVVRDLVNAFLSIFHAKPISASGGVFQEKSLLHLAETVPNVPACV